MKLQVVCVEPRYPINLGYMARVLKNFGLNEINLINPRCNYKGTQAIKYSKHAKELLQHAKIYKSLDQFTKNSLLIGTTGLWKKSSASFYNVYDLEKINSIIGKNLNKNIIVVIGRDDTGLTKEELRKCDMCLFIGTNRNYPIMNISHALAVILYGLTQSKFKSDYAFDKFYADSKYQKRVVNLFKELIKSNKSIRDKESVLMAFTHILNRASPTKKEINAIAAALSHKKQK